MTELSEEAVVVLLATLGILLTVLGVVALVVLR
jgi:hypothetical protein